MHISFLSRTLLILAVSFLNFWIWRIFQYNIYIAVSEIVLSFFLINLFLSESSKIKYRYFVILLISTILMAFIIRPDINFKLEDTKPVETLKIHEREFYLAQGLGKLFLNKVSLNYYHNFDLYFYKLQRNLFYVLDFNQYFFASHPRERGLYEFEKYPFYLFPFFMIGFIQILFKKKDLSLIYIFLILLISIFIDPAYTLGPVFLFPLINCLICLGLITVLFLFRGKK